MEIKINIPEDANELIHTLQNIFTGNSTADTFMISAVLNCYE